MKFLDPYFDMNLGTRISMGHCMSGLNVTLPLKLTSSWSFPQLGEEQEGKSTPKVFSLGCAC